MNNIESILEKVAQNSDDIPINIENRISYALKNKANKKNKFYFRNFITAITSLLCTLIGGLSVYAAVGGTIEGKPVIEWLGMNFSSNYNEYKDDIIAQQITHNETTINLISTLSDEGFTIFEFDVKVSDEDKEYLRLGQPVITDEDIEIQRKQYEGGNKSNGEVPAFEETNIYKMFQRHMDALNTVELFFDNKEGNIFINDTGYYATNLQNTTKISDNEYKVYKLYLLTDEMLGEKEDCNITFKNIELKNATDKREEINGMVLKNTGINERRINIEGEISATISKEKTKHDSVEINNINQEIKYKKLTEKIEKVTKTPIQTVIKISKTYDDIALNDLTNSNNKNFIGQIKYIVTNNDGNEIPSKCFETKRIITYSNGKKEEWAIGQIDAYKNFRNAKMETIEYLIIGADVESELEITANVEKIEFDEENNRTVFSWDEIGKYNIKIE